MNLLCDRVQSLLPHLLEGNVDEGRRADLLAHGRSCPECTASLEFYRALLAERESAASLLPPPVYYEGVLAELHLKMGQASIAPALRLRRPASRRRVASYAASFFVGLWCCVAAHAWRGDPGSPAAAGDSARAGAFAGSVAARQAPVRPPRLVALEGIGVYSADSPVLKMTPAQRRELGLIKFEADPGRALALAEAREKFGKA